jgi:predicted dehydrogenase
VADNSTPNILIVGYGSAGQRHARNLAARGALISAVDTDTDRFDVATGPVLRKRFATIAEALQNSKFDGAVVATPTAFHADQTITLLKAGCAVMLEKPLAPDLRGAQSVFEVEKKTQTPVLLGYTWRWWPALRELRARLKAGVIGRPLRAEFIMASHLEDWHPGEPLSKFFMSKAALGGGALLDESHWIDQMIWLFGEPLEVAAEIERVSSLPIDSDDYVELRAVYPEGLRVRVHLDLYTRPTERSIAVYGEVGTLFWSFEAGALKQLMHNGESEIVSFGQDRNFMFDAVSAEFISVMRRAPASCTLADGLAVLRVIEAARISHAKGGVRTQVSPSAMVT